VKETRWKRSEKKRFAENPETEAVYRGTQETDTVYKSGNVHWYDIVMVEVGEGVVFTVQRCGRKERRILDACMQKEAGATEGHR
jgi:hypothetical protein